MNASTFKISVHRKKDNVYLKLDGDYNDASASELLQALEKIVLGSLKFSTPGSPALFSFSTRSQVNPANMSAAGPNQGRMTRRMNTGPGSPTLQKLWLVGS